jgi:hypothetical protein
LSPRFSSRIAPPTRKMGNLLIGITIQNYL